MISGCKLEDLEAPLDALDSGTCAGEFLEAKYIDDEFETKVCSGNELVGLSMPGPSVTIGAETPSYDEAGV